jgi:hypothetical protein
MLIMSASSSPSASPSRGATSPSNNSVRSDDSGCSDLTSYYFLDCDIKHELGSDALPFVSGIKYSSDEESVGNNGDITRVPASHLPHYQISAIDPVTGAKVPPQ